MQTVKATVFLLIITLVFPILFSIPSVYSSPDTTDYTDWPQPRMDAQNTAFTTAKFTNTMEFSNFLSVHSRHAPIVANGCYYLIEWDTGEVHCYSVETQELIWKKLYSTIGDDGHNDKLSSGNVLTYSSVTKQLLLMETVSGNWSEKTDFKSRFYVINPNNGEVVWSLDIEDYYSNSIITDGAYAYLKLIEITREKGNYINYLSSSHCIYKIDLQLRELVWKRLDIRGGEPYWNQNFIALNDRYIITTGNDCIHELEKGGMGARVPCYVTLINSKTGVLCCKEDLDSFLVVCTPVIVKDKVFVLALKDGIDYLVSFEIQGNKLESIESKPFVYDGESQIYTTKLAAYKGKVFYLTHRGLLTCISADTRKVIWNNRVGETGYSGPYFCNSDYLIVCSCFKSTLKENAISSLMLQYIDTDTGEVLFKNPVPFVGYPPSEISATDNHIWAECGGELALFRPAVPITIKVHPQSIHETCSEDEDSLIRRTLLVEVTGRITGEIICEDEWVGLSTHSITKDTKEVDVVLKPSKLSLGIHSSILTFITNVGTIEVPVVLEILKNPLLDLNPKEIKYEIMENEEIPKVAITIKNNGEQELRGSVTTEAPWIDLSSEIINNDTETITVEFKDINKKPGLYETELLFRTNGGDIDVPVCIRVKELPQLVVTPDKIVKELPLGTHSFFQLSVSNVGGEGLLGTITSNQDWLVPHLANYNDETEEIGVTLNAKNLKAGCYRGVLIFKGNKKIVEVPVVLHCVLWITFQIGSRTIKVNNRSQSISSAPYLYESRSYIPVRKLVESLPLVQFIKNAEMKWDAEERKVTIVVDEKTIELWVDNPVAKINGENVPIDPDNANIAPQIREGRTFLPLRFVSETLGYTVEWVASTQTIHLKYIVEN